MERYQPPARVTFISHAATAALRRAAFPLDEKLEEGARAEIASRGWIAPRVQHVYTAPELRTRQTAEALGLQATVAEGLRECGYGRWSGLELEEVGSHEPEAMMAWLTDVDAVPHGGESIAKLIVRVGEWLGEQQGAGHVVAVTHPAVVRAALVYALDAPLEAFWRIDIAPLSLTDLRFNRRAWTVRMVAASL